jgi:hypothetical protein
VKIIRISELNRFTGTSKESSPEFGNGLNVNRERISMGDDIRSSIVRSEALPPTSPRESTSITDKNPHILTSMDNDGLIFAIRGLALPFQKVLRISHLSLPWPLGREG